MPRKKPWPPPIYTHLPSNRDRVRVTKPDGTKQDIWLGKSGSPEAKAAYLRIVAELEANGRKPLPEKGADIPVSKLVNAFCDFAAAHKAEKQYLRILAALKPLVDLYGTSPVGDFGPLALYAVQQHMVQRSFCWRCRQDIAVCRCVPKGWQPIVARVSRPYINRCVSFIRACFKWGAGMEMIPFSSYERLKTVAPLKKDRTPAPDHAPRMHVPDEVVAKALPYMPMPVQGLVQFQQLTGARPGEAVILSVDNIDMQAFLVDDVPVWVYLPARHKNAWRGWHRPIPIGPRCQVMLAPFIEQARARQAAGGAGAGYCFDPRHERVRFPRAGDHYRVDSYAHAVTKACKKSGVQHWTPYQLRHAVATLIEIDNTKAWERASLVLGHNDPNVIRVYAHGALQRAAKIVAKFG